MATVTVGAGRFEQSFQFHMIRDFFLLLVAVAVVELGIRYALLRYDFAEREPARVEQAAQQLANDVKSIMLNSGGPMAAQTVYPILNRNYDDLGLSIAVLPSEVTVESMKLTFNMDVKGLSPRWPEGAHQQAETALTAEQFCLGCHVKAKVGEVLGTVQVRSYLERKEAAVVAGGARHRRRPEPEDPGAHHPAVPAAEGAHGAACWRCAPRWPAWPRA